jgi:sulfate adenylyltransferase subunit 2
VWEYIAREELEVPNIYFAHTRAVIRRDSGLLPLSHLAQPKEGERVESLMVRFRTVGDMSCTCPVLTTAASVGEIIAETAITRITERGATRMDDQTSDASMELRKKEGYF